MRRHIFIIISAIVASITFSSCDDAKVGEHLPCSWELESTSGNASVKIKKEKALIYCGPEGDTVRLINECSGLWISPRFNDYDYDSCKYNKYGNMLSFKNQLCEISVDNESVSVILPPCKVEKQEELKFSLSGYFHYSYIYVYRQP